MREFVKERTKGQIDVDFDLSEETIFAIVNALHFEDVWDYYGNALIPYGRRIRVCKRGRHVGGEEVFAGQLIYV